MKNLLYLLSVTLLISCGNEPKKEKFSYERVKEEPVAQVSSDVLILNSNDQMLFDKSLLKANAGEEITLVLNHTGKIAKEFMGHNFVLLKNDTDVDDFAQRAMLAKDNQYIPEGDEMIAYTTLIGGGETTSVTFEAPSTGIYTFICTFPAHYQLMKGQLIVK